MSASSTKHHTSEATQGKRGWKTWCPRSSSRYVICMFPWYLKPWRIMNMIEGTWKHTYMHPYIYTIKNKTHVCIHKAYAYYLKRSHFKDLISKYKNISIHFQQHHLIDKLLPFFFDRLRRSYSHEKTLKKHSLPWKNHRFNSVSFQIYRTWL